MQVKQAFAHSVATIVKHVAGTRMEVVIANPTQCVSGCMSISLPPCMLASMLKLPNLKLTGRMKCCSSCLVVRRTTVHLTPALPLSVKMV